MSIHSATAATALLQTDNVLTPNRVSLPAHAVSSSAKMSDNEFSIPFERAFKRLRVDGGDLPADDASDGEGCSKRDQLLTQ